LLAPDALLVFALASVLIELTPGAIMACLALSPVPDWPLWQHGAGTERDDATVHIFAGGDV